MKAFRYILLILILLTHYESQSQSNDLHDFLVRFKAFSMTHSPKIKSFMPSINPGSNLAAMPNPTDTSKAFMEDRETGLRIFPILGKVYDPRTKYTIDYDPNIKYHVDLKAGKIYQNQSEVKVERNQKEF